MALVHAGETVEVTDRGKVVARIVPAVADRVAQLVATGVIRPGPHSLQLAAALALGVSHATQTHSRPPPGSADR